MTDPLHPDSGTLLYWAVISKELDELGLTKAEFRIFCHIMRRCGPPKFLCYAGIRKIADVTRTHPDYVRFVIRHLERRKLILRVKRPGQASHIRLADKMHWIATNGLDADNVKTAYEETAGESQEAILWARLWELLPGAPKIRYEKKMRDDRKIFESVLDELENRVKRGSHSRYSADRLARVKDTVGMFEFLWEQYKRANPKLL